MTVKEFIITLTLISIVLIPVYLLYNSRPPVDRIISVYSQGSSELIKVYSDNYRYSTGINSVELKNMSTGKSIYIKNAVVVIEDR